MVDRALGQPRRRLPGLVDRSRDPVLLSPTDADQIRAASQSCRQPSDRESDSGPTSPTVVSVGRGAWTTGTRPEAHSATFSRLLQTRRNDLSWCGRGGPVEPADRRPDRRPARPSTRCEAVRCTARGPPAERSAQQRGSRRSRPDRRTLREGGDRRTRTAGSGRRRVISGRSRSTGLDDSSPRAYEQRMKVARRAAEDAGGSSTPPGG